MSRKEILCKAIKKIGWGYIFLYFDINLGTIDILPAFCAYWMFYQSIRDGISFEEESANLLKPMAILLMYYQGVLWLFRIFAIPTDYFLITELGSVISLYFHFQLLTNLANIARKYSCFQEKSLLNLRMMQTILLTVLAFTTQFDELYEISLILVVIQIVIMICLCIVLRNFKHALEAVSEVDFNHKLC